MRAFLISFALALVLCMMPAAASAHHGEKGIDSDGDGLQNFDDYCPYDPTQPCSGFTNSDGDAYNRYQDPCDNNPDNASCDTDGDGEPNQYDPCPTVASGHLLGQDQPLPNQNRSACAGGGSSNETGGSIDLVGPNAVSPDQLDPDFPVPFDEEFAIEGDPQSAAPKVDLNLKAHRVSKGFKLSRLKLVHVAGYAIELRCAGPRCPLKRRVRLPTLRETYEATTPKLRHAVLPVGTVLTLRVIRSEFTGRFYRFKVGKRFKEIRGVKGSQRRSRNVPARGVGVTGPHRRGTRKVLARGLAVTAECVPPSSGRPVRCPRLSQNPRLELDGANRFASPLSPRATASSDVSYRLDILGTGIQGQYFTSRAYTKLLVNSGISNSSAFAHPFCGPASKVPVIGSAVVTGCEFFVTQANSYVENVAAAAASNNQCMLFKATSLPRAYRETGAWILVGSAWFKMNVVSYGGQYCRDT